MKDPVVRMFPTESAARGAADKLRERGFPDDTIHVVTPPAGDAASVEAIAAAIMAGFVLRSRAKVLAEGVRAGRSLVIVDAPFGRSGLAIDIMRPFGPVDSGLKPDDEPVATWDERTPLSSALWMPVLWRNKPAPLSSFFGMSTLSKGTTWLTALFPALTRSNWSLFGPGLSARRNPSPLSSLVGLKTLSSSKGPWRTSFGLPLLSRNPAPLSSLFGLSLLSRGR
jgi:hypothetical protein